MCLAYARTIHKFQGLTAGPVDKGKIPNIYECIICDPDKKSFEGSALGLLYTALSRATTLGDDNGLNSAIYFTGLEFKEDRVRNPCEKKGTTINFQKAVHRNLWVEHLQLQTLQTTIWVHDNVEQDMEFYLNWANVTQISPDNLRAVIDDYVRQVFLYHYNRHI